MIKSWLRKQFNALKQAKIMMLHHVQKTDCLYSPCVIETKNFENFLQQENNYLSIDDVLSSSAKKYDGAIALTIDDGLADLYTVAYPTLTGRGIPFIAFISADLLDEEGYITTAQLKEMAKNPLVTIGSHGCTHKCLDELSLEEQRYEIFSSKEKLENAIGKPIVYFAYSNGRFAKFTKKLIKKAGYKRAFGVRPRVYNCISKREKWNLPRFNLTDETMHLFVKKN